MWMGKSTSLSDTRWNYFREIFMWNNKKGWAKKKKKKNSYFVVYVFGVSMVRIFAIVNQHFNHKFIKSFFVPEEEKQQFCKFTSCLIYMATILIIDNCRKVLFSINCDVGQCTLMEPQAHRGRITIDGKFSMLWVQCVSREILIELLMMWWVESKDDNMHHQP